MSNRIEDRSEIHASPLPFLQRLPSSNAVQDHERGSPNLGFLIGQPHIGRTTKRLAVPATRRLETRDGRFAGVLLFSLARASATSELLASKHLASSSRKRIAAHRPQ